MGDRREPIRGPSQQGMWNQGQGGQSRDQQGGGVHPDRRLTLENWKDGGQERALVISEGNRPPPNQDIKCFRCLGTGLYQANCTKEPICYKC